VTNRFRLSLLAAALVLPFPIHAAQENRSRPPENVKVLTDLDGTALRQEMQRVAAGLGVKCEHCQVQGNFASDEKVQKRTARWMLEMSRAINAAHFARYERKEGESVLGRITCYTCHQGAPTAPKLAPPP
jgi:hypothetical protein